MNDQTIDRIKKHKTYILAGIGVLSAIILLMISGCEGESKKTESVSVESYEIYIEKELTGIISEIEGVSGVKVMVNMNNGTEYVYASDREVGESSEKKKYFTDADKEPILLTKIEPKVRGVAVVCKGGDNINIQNKVISLVSSVLNLPTNRIFVSS
ncbi:MAG: hypothetical protein E7652_09240 [Ruminococcaceae bacterium]|nr:hypothetical protein [Oscillospiraceae bacterium]